MIDPDHTQQPLTRRVPPWEDEPTTTTDDTPPLFEHTDKDTDR